MDNILNIIFFLTNLTLFLLFETIKERLFDLLLHFKP